eukprot:m.103701 g.103701  ORF g.103701 m.103701 type:complete len:290 (+) comp15231_c0_seq1:111-980(+)
MVAALVISVSMIQSLQSSRVFARLCSLHLTVWYRVLADRLVPTLDALTQQLDEDVLAQLRDEEHTQLATLPEDVWFQGFVPLAASSKPLHAEMTSVIDLGQQRLLALAQTARFVAKHWFGQDATGGQVKLCDAVFVNQHLRVVPPAKAEALQAAEANSKDQHASSATAEQPLPNSTEVKLAAHSMDDEEDLVEGEVIHYDGRAAPETASATPMSLATTPLSAEEEALSRLSATSDDVINAVLGAEQAVLDWPAALDDSASSVRSGVDPETWENAGLLAQDPWQSVDLLN